MCDETGMPNPIFRIASSYTQPYKTEPSEFYDIIKHVFPFEKIEIIHEDLYNLKYSFNIVKNNQTKRIDFTFKKNVYEFIIEVYKYSKNENDKKKKMKFYELISLTLKLNKLINPDISIQMNNMNNMNTNDNNMMNNMMNNMNYMNTNDNNMMNNMNYMNNNNMMSIMNQMGMNQINWCDIIQIVDESKRDQITEMIEMNKKISIDGTGKNKLLKKLISLCEIYEQIFPTQNFQFSYNIFSIFLQKENKILYLINMLNGITTISELKKNIYKDLLNPKNNDNNNNILDEEFLLDLAKKNSPEYFIFKVYNYISEIKHGYQIFDSEYSKKRNKLNDFLNQFQSKYFNQLKQKEFNSNMEILIKLIKVVNSNESLKNSLLECKKNIKLNDNNNINENNLNKFLIEDKNEINIYKEKLKSNVYINKIVDLIYKMQSLYI